MNRFTSYGCRKNGASCGSQNISEFRTGESIRLSQGRQIVSKLQSKTALILFALIAALSLTASAAHAQQGPPSVTFHWTAPTVPTPAALTFIVQRSSSAAGPFTALGSPVSGVTFTDTTVVRGNTYFYQVLSSCPAAGAGCGTVTAPLNGNSGPSNIVSGTIPSATAPPPVPGNLTLDSVQ